MNEYSRVALAAFCFSAIAGLAGCVTSTVQEIRESATGMESTDSIVVLGRRGRPRNAETELDFVSCISKNMSKGANKLNVIEEDVFVDALFPWFEPRTAPVNTADRRDPK
jgi:hypothetical protein